MTINKLIEYHNFYVAVLIPLYYEWKYSDPGSEEDEFLGQTIALIASSAFTYVDDKIEFLLSLER